MFRFLITITLFALSPVISAEEAAVAPPLSTFTAKFEVEVAGMKMGEIKRTLKKHENGVYEQSSLIYTTGFFSVFRSDRFEEHSFWRWQGNNPVPQRYTYHYTGGSKGEVYEQLDFDWQATTVDSLRDGKTTTLAIEPGVVDKLSYQISLIRDLQAGKKEFIYQVADRGDIRNISYEVVGTELLETPWGKKKTIKVKRKTLTNERITVLWFAPDLDYMVVQLIQDDNGTKMSARITDLKIDGMHIAEGQNASDKKAALTTWPND